MLALIPAWNEAASIGPVVTATKKHLPVLVVDDGSQDGTPTVAQSSGATVISHQRNQGKGGALRTGFTWGLDHGYEAILTLDADGQHDPADIAGFLEAHAAGADDLIIGRRDFSKMPFPRGIVNPIGSWLLSLALGTHIPDNQSGYRLYTRPLLEQLDLTTPGFEMEVEVIAKAVCNNLSIAWVDIHTIYGTGKTSHFRPIKDTVRFLKMVHRAYRLRTAGNC